MNIDSYVSSFFSFTLPGYSTYRVLNSSEKAVSHNFREAVESDLAKLIVYSCTMPIVSSMLEQSVLF